MFLPGLLLDVPILVLFNGGDALSICFNTVAILFLAEVDNVCFSVMLPERTRARIECPRSGPSCSVGLLPGRPSAVSPAMIVSGTPLAATRPGPS